MSEFLRKLNRWIRRNLGLAAPQQCNWVWGGDSWLEDGHNCPAGTICTPPAYRGTYLYQTATTECIPAP